MKKSVTLILVLMALAGVAVLIFRNCIDTIVTRQNSEVYRRYCKKDGLQVSWVKDYPVGDSLFFDLTVIAAEDSSAWAELLKEMNIDERVVQLGYEALAQGFKSVTTYLCERDHPENPVKNGAMVGGVVFYSFSHRIFIYAPVSSRQEGLELSEHKIRETLKRPKSNATTPKIP
jgi:hypothetical protein